SRATATSVPVSHLRLWALGASSSVDRSVAGHAWPRRELPRAAGVVWRAAHGDAASAYQACPAHAPLALWSKDAAMPNFLTRRQRTIVILVAEGRRNKEIAAALGLSVSTVRAHLALLYRTLGLQGREALARYALEHRLL